MEDILSTATLILVLAAFLAGFIDAIAGGGGLITVPALLLAGVPPVESLGTNKLQSLFGSASATIAYSKKGHVDLKKQWRWAVYSFVGACAGALLATVMPGIVLATLLPVLLILIALYFAFKPDLNDVDRAERMRPALFGVLLVPLIGFYDGLFGPGTGSFFMLAFVALAGFGVLKATAHTKLLNFASNLGGFVVFALMGVVHWKIGLLMGVAQFAGARVGAGLAMKNGAKLIRPLLVLVCIALAVRLLMDADHPIRALIGY
ncbi:TSUP family transporter [Georhizobium profundi]|uniref:TSUP family transporter n=1 Tax=Georhizobium profundi TaxID=2341112 RepID=UPI001FE08139|nr:TSUP family transporter [Georhizobium profundi]